MKRCKVLFYLLAFLLLSVGIFIVLAFRTSGYERVYGVRLCMADNYILCSQPQVSGYIAGTVLLMILASAFGHMAPAAVLRYRKKENLLLIQLGKTMIYSAALSLCVTALTAVWGCFNNQAAINWMNRNSFFYISTGYTVNVGLAYVMLHFFFGLFLCLLVLGLAFLTFRWFFSSFLPALITAAVILVADGIKLPFAFRCVEFQKCWFEYKLPFFQLIPIVVRLGILLSVVFLVCRKKEFYRE